MSKFKNLFNFREGLNRADFFLLIFVSFLFIILQGSLIARFGYRGYGPELAVILTFYGALNFDRERSCILAVILGFIRDGLGGGFLGLYPLTLLSIAILTSFLKRDFNFNGPKQIVLVVFILSLGSGLLITGPLLSIMSEPLSVGILSFGTPLKPFFISCFLTSLFSWLIFPFLNFIFKKRAYKRRDSY